MGVFVGENGDQVPIGAEFITGNGYVHIDLPSAIALNSEITLKIGTSLISQDQAYANFRTEIGNYSFDFLVSQARTEWHSRISRAEIVEVGNYSVQDQEKLKTIFYTGLYRASLFPRQLSELVDGKSKHWSPFDTRGMTYDGPLSVDSGFWDAYVAVYPLHTLVNRDVLGSQMLTGFLNAYLEGGWIPKWPQPGYASSMVGSMCDVSFADAIVKNVSGFNVTLAYESIRHNAYDTPPRDVVGKGRVCIEDYLEKGFVPRGGRMTNFNYVCYEVVSRTLNYMQSDWAIAQAANYLLNHGYEVPNVDLSEDFQQLITRSQKYPALFDNATGFFKAVDNNGAFITPFDEFAWGGDFTEGGAWQYRFYVPHDPEGLASLYRASGRSVCEILEEAQTTASTARYTGYGFEIHEILEMIFNSWGQYEQNNQNSHYMLYMFQATDPEGIAGNCSQRGMYWLRRAMTTLFRPGLDMYPGDEDNGEMGAWFALSALGLYELAPGSDDFLIGVPLFAKVVVTLENNKTLTIEAPNNGADMYIVEAVSWNGQLLTDNPLKSIKSSMLMQGGTLTFHLTNATTWSSNSSQTNTQATSQQ
eukprot:TRINITY_DN9186_c0_g1_i1.p1 TRINITY_DN9186_c0_g1~~TRINITY_DN9186_c0_g1_i1.p1  ORF type:complete len:587 (-),score=133.00 TRINITY_DN9186_c0_g1_i1:52-1812(-)